jgi:hypothetical protein
VQYVSIIPATQEAEAGLGIQGQPGQHSEIPDHKKKRNSR